MALFEKFPTIGVQHPGDVKVLLSNVKSKVEIVQGIILGQLGIVQQVWPVAMDEGTEGKTIL